MVQRVLQHKQILYGRISQNQTTTNTKSTSGDTPLNHSGQTVQLEPVPTLDMQPIKYSQSQLTEVQNTAKIIGVKAFLPQIGTAGDQLTIMKNGGSSLILDFKNFWIVESNELIPKPTPIDTGNESDAASTNNWQYITTNFGSTSYLYLQKENTYISIENLHDPLAEWQLMAIASSLKPAQS